MTESHTNQRGKTSRGCKVATGAPESELRVGPLSLPSRRRNRRERRGSVVNAHRIKARCRISQGLGKSRISSFIETGEPEAGAAKVIEVRDRIPQRFHLDPVQDIQVLCLMQRGALGARALNADLQKALNRNLSERIERFGSSFGPGDKVIQTENDYDREVFNGDLGRVVRIDRTEGVLIADFDGR